MQQDPCSVTNHCTSGEETFHFSRNPKLHGHVPKSLPLNSVLSQINTVHTISYFLKIHSNIFCACMPRYQSDNWSLPFRFVWILNLPMHTTNFSQLILDLITQIIQIFIMHSSQSSATSYLSGPNNLLNTLFSEIFSLHFSLTVQQDFHTHIQNANCSTTVVQSLKFYIGNCKTKHPALNKSKTHQNLTCS
jgi:hypothetical protein